MKVSEEDNRFYFIDKNDGEFYICFYRNQNEHNWFKFDLKSSIVNSLIFDIYSSNFVVLANNNIYLGKIDFNSGEEDIEKFQHFTTLEENPQTKIISFISDKMIIVINENCIPKVYNMAASQKEFVIQSSDNKDSKINSF